MAICRSHIFSAMAGSVAGITYLRNRYCSIVARNRTVPTDPATAYQVTQRTRFSAAVSAWQGYTNAQRQSWEDYAAGTPWKNHLGDDVRLPGLNMYLSVRLAVLQIHPTILVSKFADALCIPGLFVHPEFEFLPCELPFGVAGFILSLTNPHPTSTMWVGVDISTAQNTSINFWKGPYDPINRQVSSIIAPGNTKTLTWHSLTAGKRYFLRIRSWDSTLVNRVSSPFYQHRDAAVCE